MRSGFGMMFKGGGCGMYSWLAQNAGLSAESLLRDDSGRKYEVFDCGTRTTKASGR